MITNPNQSMLRCNGNMPVHIQVHAISWEGYAFRVLGFSWSTISPFLEAWLKSEFGIVL
jgi:hypothetical protein